MAASQVLALTYKVLGILTGLLAGIGLIGAVDFRGTITLGSVLLSLLVIALAAFFTIRSKIATIWREEAEGERAAKQRLEEQLALEKERRLVQDQEQQDLRHELRNELAGARAELKVMESRTDLTAALEAIKDIGEHGTRVSRELVETIGSWNKASVERDDKTHQLLAEIRDKLPQEPFEVKDVDAHLFKKEDA